MQNVVGPTLVAMATKFGLGAEIQSPAGLSVCLSAGYLKNLWTNFYEIFGGVGRGRWKNRLDFGGDPDWFFRGSWIFFRILLHYERACRDRCCHLANVYELMYTMQYALCSPHNSVGAASPCRRYECSSIECCLVTSVSIVVHRLTQSASSLRSTWSWRWFGQAMYGDGN